MVSEDGLPGNWPGPLRWRLGTRSLGFSVLAKAGTLISCRLASVKLIVDEMGEQVGRARVGAVREN